MNEQSCSNQVRNAYLSLVRTQVTLTAERQTILTSLCPRFASETDEDRKANLARLASCRQAIARSCDEMRRFEKRHKGIGVLRLLGRDVPNPIRVAISLLLTRALTPVMECDIRCVSRLAEVAGGNDDAAALLAIRQAFVRNGPLRNLVHFEFGGATIDLISDLVLTEAAFRVLLGLPPDEEMNALAEARPFIGRRIR